MKTKNIFLSLLAGSLVFTINAQTPKLTLDL